MTAESSLIDPMEKAELFMLRWETETGRVIGDGEGSSLETLDDCLRDYVAWTDAERLTGSLFEASL